MEERNEIVTSGRKPRVVVTGPESVGKTVIAMQLSDYFDGLYVEEFARTYVEGLGRPYIFEDVVAIARKQLSKRAEMKLKTDQCIFFDTDLIVTKLWFDLVYNNCPKWLEEEIGVPFIDLYLLCYPDLPWIEDPVRENGGERRFFLFEKYKEELEKNGFSYYIVRGSGEERFESAMEGIRMNFDLQAK